LILISAILSFAFGYFLQKKTDAQRPYLDSAIAVYAVAATWLMVNFVPENWLYFIIINAASIVLYSLRGLYFGTLMFVVYLLMSIDGYFELGWIAGL
jgi:nicotinamide mononucleotide transporter